MCEYFSFLCKLKVHTRQCVMKVKKWEEPSLSLRGERGGSAPLADSDLVTSARRDGEEIESEHTC